MKLSKMSWIKADGESKAWKIIGHDFLGPCYQTIRDNVCVFFYTLFLPPLN